MATTTSIEILLFDGWDELDALGPWEVLRHAERGGAALTCRLVTLAAAHEVTGSGGLRVRPDGVLGRPDWLVVPGGGWGDRQERGAWGEARRGALPRAIAEAHAQGTHVAAVCTGGMLVAEAGLLRGRPAVTHRCALEDLARAGATVLDARVVDDGDVVTAGGVTSGLDLGFHLVARLAGAAAAEAVAREMEFTRSPAHVARRG